ncbi:hypothetical protein Bca101_090212 [Brassica carinata]
MPGFVGPSRVLSGEDGVMSGVIITQNNCGQASRQRPTVEGLVVLLWIYSLRLPLLSLSIRRRRFAGSEESSVHIDRSFNLGIESAPGPQSLGLGFHRLFLLSLSTGTSAAVVYSRPSRLSFFSGWKPSPPPSPTDHFLLSFVRALSLSRSQSPTREIEEEAAEIATRRRKKGSSVKDNPNQSFNPSSLPPPSPINAGESVVAGTTGKAKKKAGGARDLRILSPVLWSAIRAQSSNCEIHLFSPNHSFLRIGKEICLDLVKAGCKIIAAAHRVDRLNSLCSNINSFGSTGTQATALELDVTSMQPPFEKRLRKLGKYLAYLQSDVGLIITLVHCETLFYLKKLARNLIGFVTSRFYYGHITIICFLK